MTKDCLVANREKFLLISQLCLTIYRLFSKLVRVVKSLLDKFKVYSLFCKIRHSVLESGIKSYSPINNFKKFFINKSIIKFNITI